MKLVTGTLSRIRAALEDEGGAALVLTLILLAVGSLVITPTVALTATGLSSVIMYQDETKEYYSADAGALHALWRLSNETLALPYSYQLTDLNDRTVDVTIEDQGNDQYRITSVSDGTTVRSYVTVMVYENNYPGDTEIEEDNINGDVYVDGDLKLEEGSIDGGVYVEEDLELEDDATITGDVYVGGDLKLEDDSTITGDVWVEGELKLEDDSTITGDVYVGGDLKLEEDSTITGDVSAGGDIKLEEDSMISGDVCSGGSVRLEDGSVINGDVYSDNVINPSQVNGTIYPYSQCPVSIDPLPAPDEIAVDTYSIQ